ncbi:MAG: bifunctional oligoribonuclease/PAP phosphatase NrnA [Candidatus Wallbacteria bacterium]|nr:bifunctional oligoribonuclease/PAP phosphatase NrnA [Candidatus Wallbacteria bacterium]
MRNYAPLLDVVRSRDRFLLTSHLFPDGDGLGSAIALAGGLRKLGKDALIFMPSPVPARYAFLDPEGEIGHWKSGMDASGFQDREALFVLDCSAWDRLDGLGRLLAPLPMLKVCIDHHKSACEFADASLLDVSAAATAEMVYELVVEQAGLGLDGTMAQAIYAALVTETGGFQYSNTTPRVLRLAADMLDCGVSADRVDIELYQRNPAHQIRFLARSLDTLGLGASGKMAWVAVGMELFRATGATAEDTVSLVGYPRSIDGVELALMFFEDYPNSVKISFRSKSWFDVAEFARQFGGGGHVRAAGALMKMPLAEAVKRVTEAGEKALEQTPAA